VRADETQRLADPFTRDRSRWGEIARALHGDGLRGDPMSPCHDGLLIKTEGHPAENHRGGETKRKDGCAVAE